MMVPLKLLDGDPPRWSPCEETEADLVIDDVPDDVRGETVARHADDTTILLPARMQRAPTVSYDLLGRGLTVNLY